MSSGRCMGLLLCTVSLQPLMSSQLCCLGKIRAAALTNEGLLACMRAHMVVQGRGAREQTRAEAALERFVLAVDLHVGTQVLGRGKRQGAVCTLKGILGMESAYVDLE